MPLRLHRRGGRIKSQAHRAESGAGAYVRLSEATPQVWQRSVHSAICTRYAMTKCWARSLEAQRVGGALACAKQQGGGRHPGAQLQVLVLLGSMMLQWR